MKKPLSLLLAVLLSVPTTHYAAEHIHSLLTTLRAEPANFERVKAQLQTCFLVDVEFDLNGCAEEDGIPALIVFMRAARDYPPCTEIPNAIAQTLVLLLDHGADPRKQYTEHIEGKETRRKSFLEQLESSAKQGAQGYPDRYMTVGRALHNFTVNWLNNRKPPRRRPGF